MNDRNHSRGTARGAGATAAGLAAEPEEVTLTVEQLAAACRIEPGWVVERVRAGLIEIDAGDDPVQWRFADLQLSRVRCMVSMERTMDANPELAALVADLVDEVRRLRGRLQGRG